MANVTFTSNLNTISIDFGVYSVATGITKSKWRIDSLICLFAKTDGSVIIRSSTGTDYPFSHSGAVGMKVDNINGETPTSQEHLYSLIGTCVN